eukprot:scaffold25492_cov140-Isochrysis_galbana.AAC.3
MCSSFYAQSPLQLLLAGVRLTLRHRLGQLGLALRVPRLQAAPAPRCAAHRASWPDGGASAIAPAYRSSPGRRGRDLLNHFTLYSLQNCEFTPPPRYRLETLGVML